MAANDVTAQLSEQFASFKPTPAATPGGLITGVSVPIKLSHDGGSVRLQLQLDVSVLSSPDILRNALEQIDGIFGLDVWRPSADTGQGFKSSFKKRY
jgi:hypothetical protein